MDKKIIIMFVCIVATILSSACVSTVQTVEITRIVPQTEVVTKIDLMTTTPLPTYTPYPSQTLTPTFTRWPDSIQATPGKMVTLTPGLQVADSNTRPDVEKFVSKKYIKAYLAINYGENPDGGYVFCAYQPMGIGNDEHTIKLYLWVVCKEYYFRNGVRNIGTVGSTPVVLFLEFRDGQYRIIDVKDAGGGMQLAQEKFPPSIIKQQFFANDMDAYGKRETALEEEIYQDVKAYFGY